MKQGCKKAGSLVAFRHSQGGGIRQRVCEANSAQRQWDAYALPGFRPRPAVRGVLFESQEKHLRTLRSTPVGLVRPTGKSSNRKRAEFQISLVRGYP